MDNTEQIISSSYHETLKAMFDPYNDSFSLILSRIYDGSTEGRIIIMNRVEAMKVASFIRGKHDSL